MRLEKNEFNIPFVSTFFVRRWREVEDEDVEDVVVDEFPFVLFATFWRDFEALVVLLRRSVTDRRGVLIVFSSLWIPGKTGISGILSFLRLSLSV
jgi:hypothetical protein